LQDSFAKEPYKRDDILHIIRSSFVLSFVECRQYDRVELCFIIDVMTAIKRCRVLVDFCLHKIIGLFCKIQSLL